MASHYFLNTLRAGLLLMLCPSIGGSAAAQTPTTLLHSIPAPYGTAQRSYGLGYSVAVEDGLTVVSTPFDPVAQESDFYRSYSGVVKVFNSITGALLYLLPNPKPTDGDNFGSSVAISGMRVVVGAPGSNQACCSLPWLADDAGRAYVYDLSSGTPTVPVVTLNNPGPEAYDYFGYSVAISGTRVVVGAYGDDTGATNAGSAYVYELTSGTPMVPVATLSNPGPGGLGFSVAISGTRVVAAAPGHELQGAYGSVYVYDLSRATPTVPVATLNNPDRTVRVAASFGRSVAISGTRVVVGAPFHPGVRRPGEPTCMS